MKVKREVKLALTAIVAVVILRKRKHCSTGIMCFMVFMTGWMD